MGIVEDEELHWVCVDQVIIDPEHGIVGVDLGKHLLGLLVLLHQWCHWGGTRVEVVDDKWQPLIGEDLLSTIGPTLRPRYLDLPWLDSWLADMRGWDYSRGRWDRGRDLVRREAVEVKITKAIAILVGRGTSLLALGRHVLDDVLKVVDRILLPGRSLLGLVEVEVVEALAGGL